MMEEVEHRPAILEDIDRFIPILREADKTEVELHSGYPVGIALTFSIRGGTSWIGSWKGKDVCMYGCEPWGLIGGGCPWMVSTIHIEKFQKTFLRHSREMVNLWKQQYDSLHNYVHVENQLAIKWLKWLEFNFDEPKPHGPFDAPFMRFHWEKSDV